ncbi:MAG TPA: HmuY family protein [Bacteroidales bacterium]|nr:HmuY family protein [Bacteroidales bacterium]HSA44483.1 HmuY family protein [Bacteroidales bacterium]
MKFIQLLSILPAILLLQSCFKEDERVPGHPAGDLRTDTLGMTQYYVYQLYYDLGSGQVMASNAKESWDLGFDCSSTGYHLILNTANFMKVSDAGPLSFPQALDTANRSWHFDKSDGNPDSNAIGRWFQVLSGDTLSKNHIYILDRGMDQYGDPLGFRQLVIDSLKQGTYYFRIAWLDGSNPQSYAIQKDATRNYIHFTFRFGGSVQLLEPPKDAWDLLFTQYTTLLFTNTGEPYPYLVTGVLLNPNGVSAAKDTLHPFLSFSLAEASGLTYSTALDIIGYDWKYYDFDAASYSVMTDRFYAIRDTDAYPYKLRFIGFYNHLGEKGFPVIEVQGL